MRCNKCNEPTKLYIYRVRDEYKCWKCNKSMRIILIYKPDDAHFEMTSEFAYDKPRCIIEFAKEYGIKMESRFTKAMSTPYYMHICPYCGSHQGDNYVVEDNHQIGNTVLAAEGYAEHCTKCNSFVKKFDAEKAESSINIKNNISEHKKNPTIQSSKNEPTEKPLAGYVSIEEIKLNFIYAVKKTMVETPFFNKRYYLEGKICSKVLKHGTGISFSIKNHGSETLNIFAPEECEITSNLQEGNNIKAFGEINLYENAFKNNFDCLQLKAYKIMDNGISKDKKDKTLYDIKRNGLLAKKKKRISYWGIRKYKIALITSPTSEAIADITSSLNSTPFFDVEVIPVNLYNVEQITNAIYSADRSNKYNAILLSRGGVERLDIFDEYPILYALCRCNTLTISAVGHASQTPLTNLVADIKEDTPSSAGKMLLYKYNDYRKNRKILFYTGIVAFVSLLISILLKYLL